MTRFLGFPANTFNPANLLLFQQCALKVPRTKGPASIEVLEFVVGLLSI